jgi:anaerobic magnesium-protoporphyrin IX monomethyl ester cyclase
MNVATTRGCPFKCNWCAKPIYGNRYNSRSPLHVVEEITWLISTYSPDHIWFCDDIFGLKPGWVDQFASLVKQRKLRFRFKIQSRVDLLLEEAIIDHLAAAGAETVWVGAESGSQKILDAMDKGTTVDQIASATRILKSKNIRVAFFLQFGYLGETLDDIDKTIKMTLDLMPDEIGISVSYPLPGTKFFDKVKGQLKEKQNWTDSDDLAMMFQSTYPPRFYRVLHRYVHNLYRIKRGTTALTFRQARGRSVRNLLSMVYNLPISWINAIRLQHLAHATGRS